MGIFERASETNYSAARNVFGAEPTDAELYDFILHHYDALPSENALFKLIYAAIMQIKKKLTLPVCDWALTISQLDIYFSDRLNVGL